MKIFSRINSSFFSQLLLVGCFFFLADLVGFGQFGQENVISPEVVTPSLVHLVDITGNGYIDVVYKSTTQIQNQDEFGWIENLGNGDFGPPNELLSSNIIYDSFIEDIDEDGDIDIIVVDLTNQISWFENQGNGVFSLLQVLVVSEYQMPLEILYLSDVDNDGDSDIITTSSVQNSQLFWAENQGDGVFLDIQIIESELTIIFDVVCEDINGDENRDIIVVNNAYGLDINELVLYENQEDGSFGTQTSIIDSLARIVSFSVVDIDNDDDMDIVFTTRNISYLSIPWRLIILENDGAGNFEEQEITYGTYTTFSRTTPQDLDEDGDLDLICTVSESLTDLPYVFWLENNGDGSFSSEQIITTNVRGVSWAYCADIDNDDDLEVLTSSTGDSKISWHPNIGEEIFGEEMEVTYYAYVLGSLFAVDLDGDGDNDVISNSSNDKIAWYENDSNGNFGEQQIVSDTEIVNSLFYDSSTIAFDIEGDGDNDIVSTSSDNTIVTFENDGNGNFEDEIIVVPEIPEYTEIVSFDMNGDNIIDLVTSSENSIAWYQNDGNGNFGEEQIISDQVIDLFTIFIIDLDNDNDLDVLQASDVSSPSFINNITWYENNGDGSFLAPQIIGDIGYIWDYKRIISSTDMDGDGDLDVISIMDIGQGPRTIVWFENDGDENFGEPILVNYGYLSYISIKPIDFDNDGDQDLLAQGPQTFTWFENNGNGTFNPPIDASYPGQNARSFQITNIDTDDDLDVLYSYDYKIAWLSNTANEGCTDPAACNYDSNYTIDDASCCYGVCGCSNPEAANYEPESDCEMECVFSFTGLVFYDENENGILDSVDYGIPFQEISASNGQVYYTNNQGEFNVTLTNTESSLSLATNEAFPFFTTDNSQLFIEGINQSTMEYNQALFGVTASIPYDAIQITMLSESYLCDEIVNHRIFYRNLSNVPIDGIISIEVDSLMQGYEISEEIDSANGNFIFLSFENLPPGIMEYIDVGFHTPTADYFGETLTTNVQIAGFHEGEEIINKHKIFNRVLTCAYDPNDKQILPIGMQEEHYVFSETELEYFVRFQNTGNAFATDVLVTDTIDQNLNLNSFMLTSSTHNISTTILSDDRVIQFLFENIMLPDSTTNEPESHGSFSYKISPKAELQHQTEINNTANIFFDNNPPIITNTTWSTIYDCDIYSPYFLADSNVLTASEGVSYQWYLNGDPINGTNSPTYVATITGNYSVAVTNDFGCTSLSNEIIISVVNIGEFSSQNIQLFPNPMQESSTLYFAESGMNYQVKLFDAEGRLIRDYGRITDGQLEIQRKGLSSGNYLIEVVSVDKGEKFGIQLLVE